MPGLLNRLEEGGVVVKNKGSSKLLNTMSNRKKGGFYERALIDAILDGDIEIREEKLYSIVIFDIKDIFLKDYKVIKEEVIQLVESTVLSCIRGEDLPIWMEDNRFLVLTPVIDKVQLRRILKRIFCSLTQSFFSIEEEPQIHTGLAIGDGSLSFKQLLSGAVDSLEEAQLKGKIKVFEQELELALKIDKVRKELHKMIINQKAKGFDETIVSMSQYLDELLVEYIRKSRSENYE